MNKIKIALIGDFFFSWSGGVDFLHTLYRGLKYRQDNYHDISIVLLLPRKVFPLNVISRVLRIIRRTPDYLEDILKVFTENNQDLQLEYYNVMEIPQLNISDRGRFLNKKLIKDKYDICFPIGNENIDFNNITIPYISYLFDFQHKKLPELFSKELIEYREKYFSYYVNNARCMMVHANDVANDIKTYYPDTKCKVYALPYMAFAKEQWIDLEKDKRFDNYLMISNQFWVHKDHLTAFEALELLYESGYTDLKLVCTGKMEDYRNPQYVQMLKDKIAGYKCKDNIILLGFIDKTEQIRLMKGAKALIQPTRYEGCPGGGSVGQALSLGVPCIVSDIDVNLEIEDNKNVLYFKTGDSNDLKEVVERFINTQSETVTAEEIYNIRDNNLKECSHYLMDMIEDAIKISSIN